MIIIVSSAAGFITYSKIINDVGGIENYGFAKKYIEARNVIEDKYIDIADDNVLGDAAISAMVSGLNDEYSFYMSEVQYENYKLSEADEYGNIGFSLLKTEDGGFQVVSVTSGSTAHTSGLYIGAVINAIDGNDITNMSEDEVRIILRSYMDKVFDLTLKNGETVTMDCESTHVSSVSHMLEKTEAGYVKIENFEAGTGKEFIAAVEDLLYQGAVALCVDIRDNPGGLYSELQVCLDYLLNSRDLFFLVNKSGDKDVFKSDTVCVTMPMTVLINKGSHGAAEFFAAVLQEADWATILGEPSTGNTRIQETIVLSDGSAIRLSTGNYITGNGIDLYAQGGVIPDSIVYNQSESTDDQKEAALRLMSIG